MLEELFKMHSVNSTNITQILIDAGAESMKKLMSMTVSAMFLTSLFALSPTMITVLEQAQAYIAIEVLIAILALFNNGLVLVAIYKFKHLHTSTYWLIGSLAWADVGVATLAIPSGIILKLDFLISGSSNLSTPSVTEGLCLVSVSFALIFGQVSIFSLLIIAFDHFIAICYSLRYRAIVTSFRVKLFIATAWILGALIGLIPQAIYLIDQSKAPARHDGEKRCAFEKIINMEYMVYFNSFACTFLPLAIMFILYCCIFKSANEQLRKIYCGPLCRHKKTRSSNNATLTTKTCCSQNHKHKSLGRRLFLIGSKLKRTSISDGICTNQCDCNSSDVIQYEIDSETRNSISVAETVISEKNGTLKLESITEPFNRNSLSSKTSDFLTLLSPTTCNGYSSINKRIKSEKVLGRKQSNWSTCSCSFAIETEHKRLKLRRPSKFMKKEFHAARSLATVVGVFALCWLPLHIHNVLVYFNPIIAEEQPVWLVDFAILLSHANSFINPIIYAFHLREMKKAFRKMIKPISARAAACV